MNDKRRRRLSYCGVLLLSLLFLWWGNYLTTKDNHFFAGQNRAETYYRAKVVAVSEPEHRLEEYEGWREEYDRVTLQVLLEEGAMEGDVVPLVTKLEVSSGGYKVFPYEVGDRLFVSFNFDGAGEVVWYAADHLREGPIIGLVGVFLLLLVWFGRMKGVNTVLSLVLTCGAIFLVLIPGIIKGYNIYLLTFLTTCYIIVMTLGIVIGVESKSMAAAAGCICGVGLAGLLTVVMQDVLKITGILDEDSSFVMYINPESPIDLRGVIFAAIVIGALGATMDVAMSIASSLDELLFHKPDLTNRELVASGLNIGRDIMGTMANTLVLAYVGSSLHVILLLLAYNQSVGNIINRERIAVEVLQSVAGSIGILFTVPATTFVTVAARRWFTPKGPGVASLAAGGGLEVSVGESATPKKESAPSLGEGARGDGDISSGERAGPGVGSGATLKASPEESPGVSPGASPEVLPEASAGGLPGMGSGAGDGVSPGCDAGLSREENL